MDKRERDVSIHAKKYYRVILEAIDRDKESFESFAIKLSMRTRTTMPRVLQVLRQLPCTIKSGLRVTQANKLLSILEEIGGKASVEAYFLTPGRDSRAGGRGEPMGELQLGSSRLREESKAIACPECGWEEDEGATYCSLCLKKFRGPKETLNEIGGLRPDENPLEGGPGARRMVGPRGVGFVKIALVFGSIAVLLIALLLKK